MPEWRMAEPVDFESADGEHIAIVGENGSGKSMLVDILIGRHPLLMVDPKYDFSPSKKVLVSDNIKYITFRDSYGDSDGAYYLQQRWNQHDIDENTPTVGGQLEEIYNMTGEDTKERRDLQKHLYELFNIGHLLDKYIILLSSGELRKFQLAKVLLTDPRVLIMDNPFIGLDAETRDQLKLLLKTLSAERALQIILVLSKVDDIPDFITDIVEVKAMKVLPKISKEDYFRSRAPFPARVLSEVKEKAIIDLPYNGNEYHADEVVKMNKVCIRYGKRTILQDLDWTVKNGERWALSGQNGAGKSTLLSLVCADNPQSYACDIALFGNPRGSGESIWDIKKHIGYVSPEMHRAYQKDLPAIRIVASGLKDSVGLYMKPDPNEYDRCKWWMDIFGLTGIEDRTFLKLSSGEQRLVLLARAFVKDPELLILDEPLHGLDNTNRRLVKDIIETFSKRRNKTIIMVTHYKEELPNCIDHSIFLKRHI
jgi:molybdate transport system ATP-binding protein